MIKRGRVFREGIVWAMPSLDFRGGGDFLRFQKNPLPGFPLGMGFSLEFQVSFPAARPGKF